MSQSTEERARQMGWVPKEEFKGDEERWVDAETFVDRGENIMPILKERLGKLEDDLASKTAKLEQVTTNLAKFADFHKGTYKRAYANALRDLEAEKRHAVRAGDTQAYDDAVKREQELKEEEAALDKSQDSDDVEVVPEFNDFVRSNPWYNTDVAMTAYINAIFPTVAQTAVNDADLFAKLEAEARKEFPHKFPETSKTPTVEGGGDSGGDRGSSKKKTWRDLPQEAKDAFNNNFASIEGFTKEQYAEDYFLQE